MTKPIVWAATLIFLLSVVQAWAAEPLVGRWLLKSQDVGGQQTDADPLTLRIVQRGSTFEFGYSVPVNNIQFVSMSFASHLDGTEADVKNSQGNKIGTVKITKAGGSRYKVVLEGPNRPSAVGTMTVSADGKTLTSDSEANVPGKGSTHTHQVFSRE
jgi:hypothetical protein